MTINKVNFFSDNCLYHGSSDIVKIPIIITVRHTKDFGYGFYITKYKNQAVKWAKRFEKFNKVGIVNIYEMDYNLTDLKIKVFTDLTDEWLDFIVSCRSGKPHDFDIVDGPIADDAIYNYIEDYLQGSINRDAFFFCTS